MSRRLLIVAFSVLATSGCGTTGDVPAMPIADAGFDQLGVVIGTTVTLDGSGSRSSSSDPDSGTLTFIWSLDAKPDNSSTEIVDGLDDAHPTLAPDRAGGYLISLRVSKNSRDSLIDVVLVEASNGAPTAVAECLETSQTPACQVLHGRTASLIGTLSDDPDFTPITHSWTQIIDIADCATACPGLSPCTPDTAVLSITNATSDIASVDFPETKDIMYVFQLMVSDTFDSDTDCISYTTTNTPPVFYPNETKSDPVNPTEGETFKLLCLPLDDADLGDTPTFTWVQLPPLTPSILQGPLDTQTLINVVVPLGTISIDTVFNFRVTIFDGVDSVSDDASVSVTNVP